MIGPGGSEENVLSSATKRPAEAPAGIEDRLDEWLRVRAVVITALLLLAGCLWRAWAASGTFLNPDEALHFLAANKPSLMAAYLASLSTAHPPLLIIFLYFWRLVGTSEFVLRLPSVIAGAILCWVWFRWMSDRLDRLAAQIAIVLLVFLPPMIELSAEVRQYPLLLCFMALSLYFLERALAENAAGKMLLSAVFLYLALLTHFSALLFVAAAVAYSLLHLATHRPTRGVVLAWAASQAGALGVFIFLYRTHLAELKTSAVAQRTMQEWLRNSYFHWGHDRLLVFILGRSFGVFQFVFGQRAVGDMAGLIFLAALVLLLRQKAQPEGAGVSTRQLALFLALPFALTCGAAVFDLYPYGGTRHSAFLAPFAITGVSLALVRFTGARVARGLAIAVLIIAACHLFGAPHRPYMLREDQSRKNMARAMGSIRQQVSPADPILADFQTSFLLRMYLCPEVSLSSVTEIRGLRVFSCGGYRVMVVMPVSVFTDDTFLRQWDGMIRAGDLRPGELVWVFQAGWDIGLAQELQRKFAEFHDLNPQFFGRNIVLFKLTVGQPVPAPRAPN
jgi:4-amino-4-deoxy-L-arabinose transferase-like glycosyltransferase